MNSEYIPSNRIKSDASFKLYIAIQIIMWLDKNLNFFIYKINLIICIIYIPYWIIENYYK